MIHLSIVLLILYCTILKSCMSICPTCDEYCLTIVGLARAMHILEAIMKNIICPSQDTATYGICFREEKNMLRVSFFLLLYVSSLCFLLNSIFIKLVYRFLPRWEWVVSLYRFAGRLIESSSIYRMLQKDNISLPALSFTSRFLSSSRLAADYNPSIKHPQHDEELFYHTKTKQKSINTTTTSYESGYHSVWCCCYTRNLFFK